MIEKFEDIKLFNNIEFKHMIEENDLNDFLQDFADFIAKENNINNYKIEFRQNKKDELEIGHFAKDENKLILKLHY